MELTELVFIFFTGAVACLISYALDHLWATVVPFRILYLLIRLPGIVLHECAHILGCILTGATVRDVVLFSETGGSVTYTRPKIPYVGDVIISTAPLFLLPLTLALAAWIFGTFLGCIFPPVPPTLASPAVVPDLFAAVTGTFSENLLLHFNGWFLLFLYLAVSLVLSAAPSTQDMKNAAAGSVILLLAAVLIFQSGIPAALMVLDTLLGLIAYGFTLGIVYGLVAFGASLPLLVWHVVVRRLLTKP